MILNILGKDNIVFVSLVNATMCLNSIGEPNVSVGVDFSTYEKLTNMEMSPSTKRTIRSILLPHQPEKHRSNTSSSWSTQWGLAYNPPILLLVMNSNKNVYHLKRPSSEKYICVPFNMVGSTIYIPSMPGVIFRYLFILFVPPKSSFYHHL